MMLLHRLLVLASDFERSIASNKANPCLELASAGVNVANVGLLSVSAQDMTGGTSLLGDSGKLLLEVLISEADRFNEGLEETFGMAGGDDNVFAEELAELVVVLPPAAAEETEKRSSFFSSEDCCDPSPLSKASSSSIPTKELMGFVISVFMSNEKGII